jgi:hypothetical protein
MKRDGMPAPVFLRKYQSVVFQAADMLAYEHLLGNVVAQPEMEKRRSPLV